MTAASTAGLLPNLPNRNELPLPHRTSVKLTPNRCGFNKGCGDHHLSCGAYRR
jgi:hypothetical protein